MKYKTQDVEAQGNPFLRDIMDLIVLFKQFSYKVKIYYEKNHSYSVECVVVQHQKDWIKLRKLAIALNPEHKLPEISVTLAPAESIKDLKDYEEKYYNMLKEIAENALEEKDPEVFAYLTDIIVGFEHYFCTLDEDDVPRETSSK